MAQDICAKVEPPLLQIGKSHKVACHFAGEFGSMPATPITLSALGVDGQGNSVNGAAASTEDFSRPGYADTWTDVATHKKESDALVGSGGIGTGMSDEQRGEGGSRR
jgi:peptide/nickel transport system ATP-binding protein/oligopeptide transport system ATP-binding protein